MTHTYSLPPSNKEGSPRPRFTSGCCSRGREGNSWDSLMRSREGNGPRLRALLWWWLWAHGAAHGLFLLSFILILSLSSSPYASASSSSFPFVSSSPSASSSPPSRPLSPSFIFPVFSVYLSPSPSLFHNPTLHAPLEMPASKSHTLPQTHTISPKTSTCARG